MATKKKSAKKKAPAKGAGPTKSDAKKQEREKSALKGMAIGAVICAALAAFFMLRIGDATPFEHLLKAVSGDDAKKPAATASPARHSEATPAHHPIVARTATTAKPMEQVSGSDQQALGDLIRQRSK